MSQLKKALEEKLITQEYYNHVAEEYSEVNKIELLKIEKKFGFSSHSADAFERSIKVFLS
mgnify:CR=1 FL=1